MQRTYSWILASGACLGVSLLAAGQSGSGSTTTTAPPALTSPVAPTAADYAQEPLVILLYKTVVAMHADGTGTRVTTAAVKIQSDAALRALGVVNVPFASASQKVEFLYVRARRPDGTVVETPVGDAVEEPEQVTREAPTYSDLKQKQLPVKSLHVGDTLEWQACVTDVKPEVPDQFWGQESFSNDGVTLSETVELDVPAATHVTVWTKPGDAAPSDTTANGERVVVWTHSNLKRSVGAEAEAAAEAEKKRVKTAAEELDARKGALPSLAWTTFADWAAVGAWYRGLETGRDVPDATVKARVDDLTKGLTTQEAKEHAVYNYVSTQIRYIGVSFGVGRFQPHTAAEVLANQFGDCKDKHTLLSAMLAAVGMHADAVLIGAEVRFNPDVPSPAAFNHLITQVQVDGHAMWLDSTAEVGPWGALMPQIRDQQALVILSSGEATVERTPVAVPYAAYAKLTATETLDTDLTSIAHVTMTFHDDDEIGLRAVLRQVPVAKYTEFVQSIMGSLGLGGTSTEAVISDVNDLSKPLTLDFQYKRTKEEDWGANRVTTPFLPGELPSLDEKTPPTSSIRLGEVRVETSDIVITLPPGWTAQVPEAIHAETDFAKLDEIYSVVDGKVHAEKHLEVLKERIAAADWKKYNDWAEKASPNSFPYLQLRRPTGEKDEEKPAEKAGSPSDATPAPAGGETAHSLIERAIKDIHQENYDEASVLLNQAKDLDPKARSLYGEMGYVAFRKGNQNEAMRLYQRELDIHPESTWVYRNLALLQHATGDKAGAADTMHQWTVQEPENPKAAEAAIAFLVEDNNGPAALKEANSALAHIKDMSGDESLEVLIGRAQLLGGEKDKGAATLLAVLKVTTDPGTQNDAAYELADAKLELPMDEQMERTALTALGKETQSWTLNELPATLNAKSTLIVAAWDTMGWILFREGKLEAAESYIRAAWMNRQDAVVGEHLGDIQMARGDASGAVVTYTLAIESLPKADMMGVRQEDPKAGELRARVETAMKAGGKKFKGDAHKDLQKIRSVALGSSEGASGTAEYLVLMSHGAVVRALASGDKTVSNGETLIKSAQLAPWFPSESDAAIVKPAMLNCSSGRCELFFFP